MDGIPICVVAFDLMELNGVPLLRLPLRARRRLLTSIFNLLPGRFSFAKGIDVDLSASTSTTSSSNSSNSSSVDEAREAREVVVQERLTEELHAAFKGSCEGLMAKLLDTDGQDSRLWENFDDDDNNNNKGAARAATTTAQEDQAGIPIPGRLTTKQIAALLERARGATSIQAPAPSSLGVSSSSAGSNADITVLEDEEEDVEEDGDGESSEGEDEDEDGRQKGKNAAAVNISFDESEEGSSGVGVGSKRRKPGGVAASAKHGPKTAKKAKKASSATTVGKSAAAKKGKQKDEPNNATVMMLSTYEPDARSNTWKKLKRDYLEGVGDTIDVIPIGGWQGQGRKAKWISPFLLGVYNRRSGRYESLCRVMSGFTDEFYRKWSAFYLDPANEMLIEHESEARKMYDTKESPQWWFRPPHPHQNDGSSGSGLRGHVWEIKGADLTLSPVHQAALGFLSAERGISLRFPRFLRLREDKGPEDTTSPKQLADLYRAQARKEDEGGKGQPAKGVDDENGEGAEGEEEEGPYVGVGALDDDDDDDDDGEEV